ncbi:MAG: hypothetical protein II401_11460 [Bacteroidales bacterium]|nr:hypothetical protein [Bacteroidales bacterium]
MKKDNKTKMTLLLDREVAEWIMKEAEQDGITPDEVVNNRLLCLMFVHSLDEEEFNELRMALQSRNNGELPS